MITVPSEEPVPLTSILSKSGVYAEDADVGGGFGGASPLMTVALAYGAKSKASKLCIPWSSIEVPAHHAIVTRQFPC